MTLEDAVLDPERAEAVRAAVDGEWIAELPPSAVTWDYTGGRWP